MGWPDMTHYKQKEAYRKEELTHFFLQALRLGGIPHANDRWVIQGCVKIWDLSCPSDPAQALDTGADAGGIPFPILGTTGHQMTSGDQCKAFLRGFESRFGHEVWFGVVRLFVIRPQAMAEVSQVLWGRGPRVAPGVLTVNNSNQPRWKEAATKGP